MGKQVHKQTTMHGQHFRAVILFTLSGFGTTLAEGQEQRTSTGTFQHIFMELCRRFWTASEPQDLPQTWLACLEVHLMMTLVLTTWRESRVFSTSPKASQLKIQTRNALDQTSNTNCFRGEHRCGIGVEHLLKVPRVQRGIRDGKTKNKSPSLSSIIQMQ